jgi:hypothetical protein
MITENGVTHCGTVPDKIACHAILSPRITLYHVTPRHVTLHHVTLHHVTLHPTGGNPMQEMINRGLSEEQRMIRQRAG